MKNHRSRRGTLIVLALGVMTVVSIVIISQLESVRMGFPIARNVRYQLYSDLAARSGIEYGYALIKNVMESMSMMGLRFATHYSGDSSGPVAEVPPYWLQVLDPGYDLKAREDLFQDSVSNDWTYSGNWVGTDSFISPFDVDDASRGLIVLDHGFVMRNPEYLHDDFGSHRDILDGEFDHDDDVGFMLHEYVEPEESETRECPIEVIQLAGGSERYIILFDSALFDSIVHCDALEGRSSIPWDNRHDLLGEPVDYYLDGHFGDKRWHYYDGYNFSLSEANINIPSSRGTGGSIRVNLADSGGYSVLTGLNPHGDGNEKWFDNDSFSNFFERLFYYDYWNEDHNALLSSPPYHEPDDDSDYAYHVRLFTNLHFDLPEHIASDGAPSSADQKLFDPDEYSGIDFMVFFKLWVIRDKRRDNFGESVNTFPIVTTFSGDHKLKDWWGNEISGTDTDLHPIWAIARDSGTIDRLNATGATYGVNVTDSSYWRRNFLLDWHGRNAVPYSTYQRGVLAWPMPYLAYQRGDYDYFLQDKRGLEEEAVAPLFHEHYTKFVLYSLGTVRVPDEELLTENRERNRQSISDFKVVARSLYKLVFYMEVRAPDTIDDDEVSHPLDTGYEDGVNFMGAFDYKDVVECDADQQNQMNWAFFNSRFIPICDIQASKADTRKKFFEPRGIYMRSIEKVPYSDSKL